jgi:multidrug efflux pump subunit AcrB
VVAENIVRLRESGRMPLEAARLGTSQVAGALLASTLTTIAVFLPVIFMEGVEGQLFADLALTISIAVAISLLIAVTVLPAAAGGWLKAKRLANLQGSGYPRVIRLLMRMTDTRPKQLGCIAALVAVPALGAWLLMPQLDYLPPVKRAAIDAHFSFPPGMSPVTVDREIAPVILERMAPYMSGEKEPALKNWYLLLWPGGGTIGARVIDENRIGELERIVRDEIIVGFPDTRAFASEGDLFGSFGGSARAIQIHLQSADTEALNRAAESGRQLLTEKFPGANVQAFPAGDAAEPELRLTANDRRLAEVGWNRAEVGTVVRTVGDGLWLGEHFDGDRRLPIILRANGWDAPESLSQLPLATPQGGVLPLGELVHLETTMAPSQIRRVDRRRTVTLTVDPPPTLSLEQALATVEEEIVPPLRQALPAGSGLRVSGSADRLDEAVAAMGSNFAMALLVLFLLMAAMFRSLRDSAFVMLALPMAVFGGVLGMRLLGLVAFQPLDLLSMIGFIMLLGMVVNNAILLVAQARAAEAEGLGIEAAVEQALTHRMRPILIGALTGVVGALPMAVNPGPGSVIYRGLAAITIGGVGLSLVFTLLLMPALLRFAAQRRTAAAPAETVALEHAA